MQYNIIFSTYNNKTKSQATTLELEQYLVELAKRRGITGFSLSQQLGYWSGELEQSHILALLDVDKPRAFAVANDIKQHYKQDAVIVQPIKQTNYFI